jgi:hypothetical protein
MKLTPISVDQPMVTFYGTAKIIAVFTGAHHWTLS